jgi:hypothetical protein
VGSTDRGRRVLQALFDLGPTSRVELARQAGVNRTTISGIVQPLLDQRILVESKPAPPRRRGSGKPARPLWFSPNARPLCGALVMPGSIRAASGRVTEGIRPKEALNPTTPLKDAGRARITRRPVRADLA